ncbi:amidase [Limosilactobacillus fermentum]|uniref:amidase n=1 Tax=Limosilactobacillus fermentum TaxID=1613 RepID=UPI001C006B58|nr:amidase [Limosilactobacillus fermentum]
MIVVTTDLLSLTGTEMAQAVRNQEVSAKELVSASLARIKETNPALNAVISLRAEEALTEADQLIDRGQPFLGVPLLLKGLGQTFQGLPATNGNRLFKDQVAQSSSNFARALTAAGFIVLGQTNYPEFGFKNITDSKMYGNAHNPWNLAYYPGGSSGGAGAAVANKMVPIAGASDGGGSIRIPASWTSTIGLKPTRGRVITGPSDWRSWQGAAGSFAITKDVEDTARLLDVLQALQSAAVFQVPLQKPSFAGLLKQTVKPVRVGFTTESPVATPVDPEAVAAVHQAATFLEQNGFEVEEIEVPTDGRALIDSYYLMNEGETAAMFEQIEASLGRAVTVDDMEPLTWALYRTGRHISAATYSNALAAWDQAGYQMATLHETYPLVLTPTTAMTAPRIDQPMVSEAQLDQMRDIDALTPAAQQRFIFDQWLPSLTRSPFTQQANLTGEPAISLPTHLTKAGLPLGIQLVAAKGQEGLLLQVAKLFETQGRLLLKD